MPITKEIEAWSLKELLNSMPDLPESSKPTLMIVNQLIGSKLALPLSRQSLAVIQLLKDQLNTLSSTPAEEAAELIFFLIKEQGERETEQNRLKHRRQGAFTFRQPIHQRSFRDQLQDDDMTSFMPKSEGNIEVLAALNRFDTGSTDALPEVIRSALKNKKLHHIIIPAGPGHWRGVYLTKPSEEGGKYQLELFDPYGPAGAHAITQIILGLLNKSGIKSAQINIGYTGPTHPQTDGYACGDYTCAHSHKKMKEFGAKKSKYNQEIIDALESQGNENGHLRTTVRKISEKGIAQAQSHRVKGNIKTAESIIKPGDSSSASKKDANGDTSTPESPQHKEIMLKDKQLIDDSKDLFNRLLQALKIKTDELTSKGTLGNSNYNAKYQKVAQEASTLYREIEKAGAIFFAPGTSPTETSYCIFSTQIKGAIRNAKDEFATHRNSWNNLHPILRGFIGFLALLPLAIPALVISYKSKHGFFANCFASPKTEASEKLEQFNTGVAQLEQQLELGFQDDNAPDTGDAPTYN